MDAEIVDVVRFTDQQRIEAKDLQSTIESAISRVNTAESALEYNYAHLGSLLVKVSVGQYWRLWGFPTWTAYLSSVRQRMHKGRTQMYEAIGIARKLLPVIGEKQLGKIGITKAKELKRMLAGIGRVPREIVEKAADEKITAEQLRAEIFRATHIAPQYAGSYFDLGGFYATKEERAEIEYAFEIARRTDPVIPREGTPSWAQLKQIVQRLCQEYVGTWGAVVEGGG